MQTSGKAIGVRLDEGGERVLVRRILDWKIEKPDQRSTIIFDLNNVLCVKWFDPEAKYIVGIHCHARHGNLAFYIRPGIKKFMQWIISTFGSENVWIWTTAHQDTAHAIVPHISSSILPSNILSAEHCIQGRKELDNPALPGLLRDQLKLRIIVFDDDITKYKPEHQALVRCCPGFAPSSPFDSVCLVDQGVRWMQQSFES